MAWEIGFTRQAADWYRGLDDRSADRVDAALGALRDRGPTLGRPLADRVKESRHHNMKELRVPSSNLRALFAFDPQQRAAILVGGDKTGNYKGWYRTATRDADRLYENHLRNLGKGGSCLISPIGRRSAGRER